MWICTRIFSVGRIPLHGIQSARHTGGRMLSIERDRSPLAVPRVYRNPQIIEVGESTRAMTNVRKSRRYTAILGRIEYLYEVDRRFRTRVASSTSVEYSVKVDEKFSTSSLTTFFTTSVFPAITGKEGTELRLKN